MKQQKEAPTKDQKANPTVSVGRAIIFRPLMFISEGQQSVTPVLIKIIYKPHDSEAFS